jgi:predicted DNA-binding WGR domain protein
MNTFRFENTNPGHNKFYEFQGIQSNGRFTVKATYGRIGQAGQVTVIYDGVSKTDADKEFQKKMQEKVKKGYVLVAKNDTPTSQPPAQKKTTPILFP